MAATNRDAAPFSEGVVMAEKKSKTEEKVKHALGREDGEDREKKHHVHGMHIRRAHNGGFIARHELADEDGNPAEGQATQEHILPDMDSAHAALDQHMGDQPAAGAAGEPQGEEEQA
jgi:hypothetical protein